MRSLTVLGLIFTVLLVSAAYGANKSPMFSKGVEIFRIEISKGKTPQFRVLDDNATDKALALATIAFINSHQEVQPKVPMRDYIDLKIETLKLKVASDVKHGGDLDLTLKLSGYELELDRTVKKDKFLSGQTIEINYPSRTREVAMFTVNSSGSLRMRLDTKTNELILQNVHAKMDYDSQFGGSGWEDIRFSGKGIRQ